MNQSLRGAIIGRVMNLILSFKMLFHAVSYALAEALFFLFNKKRAEEYIAISIYRISLSTGYFLAVFVPLMPVYTKVDGN